MPRRGRPKKKDEAALYRMGVLVEEHHLSIRAAASRVATERGLPDHQASTFVEWARKEFARRRDQESLPTAPPVSSRLVAEVRELYRTRAEEVASARAALKSAKAMATELGINLEEVSVETLASMQFELSDLGGGSESGMGLFVLKAMSEGLSEQEALQRLEEENAAFDLLQKKFQICRKYLWAKEVLSGSSPELGEEFEGRG